LKNIIISGTGRIGKTTLARRIGEELGYFVINLDRIVAIFHGAYPQMDIRFGGNINENLAPFIGHFLGAFSSDRGVTHEFNLKAHAVKGNRFVMEGVHFDFDMIIPILKTYGIGNLKDSFILIGLTCNNKTADELFDDLRKHDTEDDWTYGFDDDKLRKECEYAISLSRSMTEHLAKYGFTIYDTPTDRESLFAKILNDIRKTNNQLNL